MIHDPLCEADGTWEVENYGGGSYGTMTLDQATTNSVNTVYAQLISEVGPERVKDMIEDLGFAPKFGEEEIAARTAPTPWEALWTSRHWSRLAPTPRWPTRACCRT